MVAQGNEVDSRPLPERFLGNRLEIDPTAWVAPSAVVVGEVTLGAGSSVWYGCVVRGDIEPIRIGADTNVQDGTVIHVDHGQPAIIGDRVTIGHRAVVHGCTVEDDAMIGMGAIVLSGARVGAGAVIAAGALVREGFEIPPGTLAAGVPARVLGPVTPTLRTRAAAGVHTYRAAARGYAEGRLGGGPHGGGPTIEGADE